jgi:probable phosphoglycerate mutase
VNKLFIIRHGQDEDNKNRILNGRRNSHLTLLGKKQAEKIAKLLKKEKIDIILSSPLNRACETANIIGQSKNIKIIIEDDLIERDFGILTGKPIRDIKRYCKKLLFSNNINYFLDAEGAESFPDLYERAKSLLNKINRHFTNKNILIVTHGDIGKMIQAVFHGWGWKRGLKTPYLGNANVIKLYKNNVLVERRENICILCNGCGRRMLDVERLKNFFRQNNFNILDNPKKSDLIIFITCAFTNQREQESINIIKKIQKYKARLIIAGCLPEIAKKTIIEKFKETKISTKHLQKIDDLFIKIRRRFVDIPDTHEIKPSLFSSLLISSVKKSNKKLQGNSSFIFKNNVFGLSRTKSKKNNNPYYLRISYGCLGNCSYCGIKKAIGILKSKPLNVCVDEYKQALRKKFKDIIILADDVGAYGLDIGSSFPKLLDRLMVINPNANINWSLKELHPRWIIKYKTKLRNLLKNGKINHILCGIQSGNDRILKLMNRYHNSKDIISVLKDFKKSDPKLKLSAQIIAGFPSETHKEFLDTLNLLISVGFDDVIIYPYSKRYKTIAEKLKNKIPDNIKRKRIVFAIKYLKNNGIKAYSDSI